MPTKINLYLFLHRRNKKIPKKSFRFIYFVCWWRGELLEYMANIGGQRPACGSQFSHTTMCVLGNELRTSSLVAGASIPTKQHFYLNELLSQMCLLIMILLDMRCAFKSICIYVWKSTKTEHKEKCYLNRTIL